jgi:hypothetical protein
MLAESPGLEAVAARLKSGGGPVLPVPFRTSLSLDPLVAFWRRVARGEAPGCRHLARTLLKDVDRHPELEGVLDPAVLQRHLPLVESLLSAVLPPALAEVQRCAVLAPFGVAALYATPAARRDLLNDYGMPRGRLHEPMETLAAMRVTLGYLLILRRLYGCDVELNWTNTLTVDDAATGLERHFQLTVNPQFMEVLVEGELPPLAEDQRRLLLASPLDHQLWQRHLPPERFRFHGLGVMEAVDVTEQHALSALKEQLVSRNPLLEPRRFENLQQKLRTLLGAPGLRLRLASLSEGRIHVLNPLCEKQDLLLLDGSEGPRIEDLETTLQAVACRQRRPVVVEDLASLPERAWLQDETLALGYPNLLVAPLEIGGEVVGVLELNCPRPGQLNDLSPLKLSGVIPLFAAAVRRTMDEFHAEVQAVMKEQFTALHPAVEWRFRQAATQYLRSLRRGRPELPPVVFKDVYPLFGVSDIRSSSTLRNAAIQADLIRQLELAGEVLSRAYEAGRLPYLGDLGYRVQRQVERLRPGLSSGDEVAILDFLRADVEPLFPRLRGFGPAVEEAVQAYLEALDPHLNILYHQRRDFEESVGALREMIAGYLDQEQDRAQAMFPHYFELRKSDGVDHSIYIGASLVESGDFDLLYLRNLRLWQLEVMAVVAARCREMAPRLKQPLQTAHLILVQDTPLSIRFHVDEKQFNVDGAYNVRYEILKKRLDKATVRGTGQRLTQPDQIAIVYSHPREASEYRGYIEYLQAQGRLAPGLEELELDHLQGAQGLRALRVSLPDPA